MRSPILHRPGEYWFFPADSNKLVIANQPLWFNRYGFPTHLEPRKQIGAAAKRFRS